MKLTWGFLLSSLQCAASAAKTGHVFIHDPIPKASSQAATEVNPVTARLILAQRLGLSRFHSIKHDSEDVIRQINAFGGQHQKLFGEEDLERTRAHALVWVDDVDNAEAIVKDSSRWSSDFAMTNPPSGSDNDRLVQDMIQQAESLPKMADPKGHTFSSGNDILDILKKSGGSVQSNIHNDYLTVYRVDKTNDLSSAKIADMVESLRLATVSSGAQGFSITVVVMPSSSSHSKRSAKPYGTYSLPANMEPRRELPEAPLSLASSKPSTSPNPNVSDLEDFPIITQAEKNVTTPPLGILPSCWESVAACTKGTNGCSGHGECTLFRKGDQKVDKENGRADCYACACKPTVVKEGGKGMESRTRTTYWGGPACQKKDVSVPFWLFVISGVLLASLISAGIGMLYSMGSEELPSVIGAGVSGPVRK